MSDRQVTYILGAGASAKALPLAKDIKTEKIEYYGLQSTFSNLKTIVESATNFNSIFGNNGKGIGDYYKMELGHFYDRLSNFSQKLLEFETIDTYAKALFLQNRKEEFKDLKQYLAEYLFFEQVVRQKFDNRYLVFLVNILNNLQFPSNLKIISWNYDYQFEIALHKLYQHNVLGNFKSYPVHMSSDMTDYNLVHLNGVGGADYISKLRQSEDQRFRYRYDQFSDNSENIEDSLNLMFAIHKASLEIEHLITFGFEKHDNLGLSSLSKDGILYSFYDELYDTTDLIIIGYSFPYFNQETDEYYLRQIIESGNLQNVVIQDPTFTKEEFISRFDFDGILSDENSEIEITTLKNTDQFFIPRDVRFETE